jgi:hypothetical protein
MLGKNMTADLALDRERWRELLVAAQVLQGPLSLGRRRLIDYELKFI